MALASSVQESLTTNISQTDFGYTGQRDYSADFGLMDYNARIYNPTLARFTQLDTVVPQPGNSQAPFTSPLG